MAEPVTCSNCGASQELPAGYARPQFRCRQCGSLSDVPQRQAAPTPLAAGAAKAEVLIQGTQDDDFNPYEVRGDVLAATCPDCGNAIHAHVTKCIHCGVDFEARRKAQRTFTPVDRTWEVGWPLSKRLMLFAGLQAINVAAVIASFAANLSAAFSFVGVAVVVAVQAFLLGTYDRIHLTRNAKGKAVLTRTWRFAFWPRTTQTVRWKEHEGIRVVVVDDVEPFDWMICIWLGCCGVLPGVLFWWFNLRGDRFHVALCKDHGFPHTVIFRTLNRARADEVARTISETAILPLIV